MRILVTGGAGFVGSHYVRTMLGGGYPGFEHAQVTVLDKLTQAGNLANLDPVAPSPRFSLVRGDICDAKVLERVLPGHEIVVNFAEESSSTPGAAPPGYAAANAAGVEMLLQACVKAGVRRVVQVSTEEVYGSVSSWSWREYAPLAPTSPYAAAKAGGDLIAHAYARIYGLDVSITRGCSTYGPHQYPDKVIPHFITGLLDGTRTALYGDGRNVRRWVHVDDHCRGIQLVLEKGQPGEVYHIGGDTELSGTELVESILQVCGASWDMVAYGDDPCRHDRLRSLDDSLLRGLGYAPQVPFDQGLAATVRWYRENRRWWEPLKATHADPVGAPAPASAEPERAKPVASQRKFSWRLT